MCLHKFSGQNYSFESNGDLTKTLDHTYISMYVIHVIICGTNRQPHRSVLILELSLRTIIRGQVVSSISSCA